MPVYEHRLPEQCEHPGAFGTPLVTRTERGYRARCPLCGMTGPVLESLAEARRALADIGRKSSPPTRVASNLPS